MSVQYFILINSFYSGDVQYYSGVNYIKAQKITGTFKD